MRFAPLILTLLTASTVLSGCARPIGFLKARPVEVPAAPDPLVPLNIHDPVVGSDALWVPETGGLLLGEGVASLGDVTRPGAWVRAGFLREDGAQVEVETDAPHGVVRIRVTGVRGDGPVQLSLAAYQALGLIPTTLPVIRVLSTGDGDAD